jgi:hypothetical protein
VRLSSNTWRHKMEGKDRVMIELEEYLDTLEEDYVDPAERKREKEEYLADHQD